MIDVDRIDARVRIDGTTTMPGSDRFNTVSGSDKNILSCQSIRAFDDNQYVTLQILSRKCLTLIF